MHRRAHQLTLEAVSSNSLHTRNLTPFPPPRASQFGCYRHLADGEWLESIARGYLGAQLESVPRSFHIAANTIHLESKAFVLLDFPFASVVAFNALKVMLTLLVVMVFGIAAMYNRRKRKASVYGMNSKSRHPVLVLTTMSSKVWWVLVTPERAPSEEGLQSATTQVRFQYRRMDHSLLTTELMLKVCFSTGSE